MSRMRFKSTLKVCIAISAVFFSLAFSCEKRVEETSSSVTLQKAVVEASAGQQFVNVQCAGEWILELRSDEDSLDWASLNVYSGKGNKSNIILTYGRNNSEHSREFRVVLDDGKSLSVCSMLQLGDGQVLEPEPDVESVPGADLSRVNWMELPAMDNEALDYLSHSFEFNGKIYRNYTFAWSQDDFVAWWVAYPLCGMYTNKTVNRTNSWAYDPLLGKGYSSAPFGGYGGAYARGHQLPSADRLCCVEANAQTFYGTNITPQLNEHNERIWGELEGKVRTIANASDTTYVVTGCIVRGAKEYTTDSDGNRMPVPVAYYKALLRYGKNSTLGQWNAAAFYLEHRAYSESLGKQHSMSIDRLEEILGIDLFVNLPAKVGAEQAAKIEAADPAGVALWW